VGIDHEGIGHEVVQALSGPAVEHEQVKAAQRAAEHDQRDQPVCDDLQRRREGDVQSERRAVQGPGDREDREAQRRACRSDQASRAADDPNAEKPFAEALPTAEVTVEWHEVGQRDGQADEAASGADRGRADRTRSRRSPPHDPKEQQVEDAGREPAPETGDLAAATLVDWRGGLGRFHVCFSPDRGLNDNCRRDRRCALQRHRRDADAVADQE
jgi:hypothetical protein